MDHGLHKSLVFTGDEGQRIRVDLDIASGRVAPTIRLTAASAQRFVKTGHE